MNKKVKLLSFFGFSLLLSFLAIGYAAIAETLYIYGTISVETPNGIVITEVNEHDSSEGASCVVNSFSDTVLDSSVTLAASADSYVSVKITVYNGSGEQAYYQGMFHSDVKYSNNDIVCTTDLAAYAPLPAGTTRTFTATFKYASYSSTTDNTLDSLINFKFNGNFDVVEKFDDIVNDPKTFDSIIDHMQTIEKDENGDPLRKDDTYVGNVVGATQADKELINELFTGDKNGKLTHEIDGVQKEITVLIKYEDLDGDGEKEMTVYMTPDTIPTDKYNYGTIKVTVYAAVFKNKGTAEASNWQMIGELYKGTADVNKYNSNAAAQSGKCNSFSTDTWKSEKEYNGHGKGSELSTIIGSLPK